MAVRLYVEEGLAEGGALELGPEQTHYLAHVMRLGPGDCVHLFNGRDGEWETVIEKILKKRARVMPRQCRRAQETLPDLWLLFAPIKRNRIENLVEKATELGVVHLKPVITERTEVKRVNEKRLKAHAIEAAEQTERLSVPEIGAAEPLESVLAAWPAARRLLLCDETGGGPPILEALAEAGPGSWALLTGPEGGFAPAELDRLRRLPFITAASLGPRVLRADTAAVAAMTCWQTVLGDWQRRPSFRFEETPSPKAAGKP
ncbi:MAG: 16S rRNA (uracil(1498)-N(3))-methyltransferase [Alphaproteobacteria bacterium]|nr:16S rRNA (uracil(1498)-N(3))-methyltransferase [Alphaproteobacteria bacterium]